jgi:acetylornithine deacetylase/succinyl-diaminopimelate desuccinylase-like protein
VTDTNLDAAIDSIAVEAQAALLEWLKIASISGDPAKKAEVRLAAEWAANRLRKMNLKVRIQETDRHPLVIAETAAVPGAPIALVYGHYDVQPVEPLEKWVTPPFEPSVRDGNVYARGATDDKGQVLTHLMSLAAWQKSGQALPLQVKILLEGEEEIGSASLENQLESLASELACDVVVISDSSQFAVGQPAITYGLRGICGFELSVEGPNRDLHSGSFGGAVTNPAWALASMLASIRGADGKIQLPRFYDDIRPMSQREQALLSELDASDERLAAHLGVECLTGEEGYNQLHRRWARPSFDINGLTSGHQGPGGKTIIPATASAKFTFRLVPEQDPKKVAEQLREHLHAVCPRGVRWHLQTEQGGAAMLANLDSPAITAAEAAIESAFKKRPVLIREGGSIPIVARFQEVLQADCLLLGWGLDDDNAHSPNEKFCLEDFHRGIRASAYLWRELGKIQPNR